MGRVGEFLDTSWSILSRFERSVPGFWRRRRSKAKRFCCERDTKIFGNVLRSSRDRGRYTLDYSALDCHGRWTIVAWRRLRQCKGQRTEGSNDGGNWKAPHIVCWDIGSVDGIPTLMATPSGIYHKEGTIRSRRKPFHRTGIYDLRSSRA